MIQLLSDRVQVEILGSVPELHAIRDGILTLLEAGNSSVNFPGETSRDPKPYPFSLRELLVKKDAPNHQFQLRQKKRSLSPALPQTLSGSPLGFRSHRTRLITVITGTMSLKKIVGLSPPARWQSLWALLMCAPNKALQGTSQNLLRSKSRKFWAAPELGR